MLNFHEIMTFLPIEWGKRGEVTEVKLGRARSKSGWVTF